MTSALPKRTFWQRVLRRSTGKSGVRGFVERFERGRLGGWAVAPDGQPVELSLRLGEVRVPLDAAWEARKDVEGRHAGPGTTPGFRCELDAARMAQLDDCLRYGSVVEVLANGAPLRLLCSLPEPAVLLGMQPLGLQGQAGGRRVDLLEWGNFRIRCRVAADEKCALPVLGLRADGVDTVAPPAYRVARSARLGDTWEIELPPGIWRVAGGETGIRIDVLVDGEPAFADGLRLTLERAAGWLEDITQASESLERDYLMMLALEHASVGGLLELVPEAALETLRGFAGRMQVDKLLDSATTGRAPAADLVVSPSANDLAMRRAMVLLNDRLTDNGDAPVLPLLLEVLETTGIAGDARTWFVRLATQLCCDSGEFEDLKAHIEVRQLLELAGSGVAEQLSLALPALVSEGMIDEAIRVLYRLRSAMHTGWMHTGCVRYAVQAVQSAEGRREFEPDKADWFRQEFLKLLADFRGEWFSRLHDVGLIDALVRMLADAPRCREPMREALCTAAVREYGLVPAFWERFGRAVGVERLPELARAQVLWTQVREELEARGGGGWPVAPSMALVEALEWFVHEGNHDAVPLLREVIANSAGDGIADDPAARAAMRVLLRRHPEDAVRFGAFPDAGLRALALREPGDAAHTARLVRRLSEPPRSVSVAVQQQAGKLCQELAHTGWDAERFGAALDAAVQLGDWGGGYLDLDLCAQLLRLDGMPEATRTRLCARLQAGFHDAIGKTRSNYFLPAAGLAALARLQAHPGDALEEALVAEIRLAVASRFGNSHDGAVAGAPSAPVAGAGASLHADALVLLVCPADGPDCSNDAWVERLGAVGAAHLYVRAGTQEGLSGDTLFLDVDPTSPAGALRAIGWVLANTTAQYIVRVQAGCYLDTELFFGSLVYRKHHYYGSIVRIGPDAFARAAGDVVARSAESPILLDRTPVPSSFADGRLAFSLSRLAAVRLGVSADSLMGQRYAASSRRADKLIGDLLALAGIFPADEEYRVHVREALGEGALPVARGANFFMPSEASSTVCAALGDATGVAEAEALRGSGALLPLRLWPSCWPVSLGHDANQLEMLTDPGQAARLLREDLVVVAVARNEMLMLPHFLAHYRKLGVRCFMIADNCSDDGTREFLYEQDDVLLYSVDTQYRKSHYGVAWQLAMLGGNCLGKWVVVADADEFLVYRDCESVPLRDHLAALEAEGADAALVHMIDMYPWADLDEARFDETSPFEAAPWFDAAPQIELRFGGGQYGNSRNFVNALRHRIAPSRINAYVSQKYAVMKYKPWMRLSEGIHYAANQRVAAEPMYFAHFKYHAGFKHKVLTEIERKQHFNGAEEYARYAGMLAEGQGAFGREGTSVRFASSRDFCERVR